MCCIIFVRYGTSDTLNDPQDCDHWYVFDEIDFALESSVTCVLEPVTTENSGEGGGGSSGSTDTNNTFTDVNILDIDLDSTYSSVNIVGSDDVHVDVGLMTGREHVTGEFVMEVDSPSSGHSNIANFNVDGEGDAMGGVDRMDVADRNDNDHDGNGT